MDTSKSKQTMVKLAALQNGRGNVNRLIIANLANYTALEAALADFVIDPADEKAEAIDAAFLGLAEGIEAIRAAVAQVALTAAEEAAEKADAAPQEQTWKDIGTEEEGGIRLQ